MDEMMVLIGLGLVGAGVLIGWPIGRVLGYREAVREWFDDDDAYDEFITDDDSVLESEEIV